MKIGREELKEKILNSPDIEETVRAAWMTLKANLGDFRMECPECGASALVISAGVRPSSLAAANSILSWVLGKPDQKTILVIEKDEYHRRALRAFIRLKGLDDADAFAKVLEEELNHV
jgi:hypothetical protein